MEDKSHHLIHVNIATAWASMDDPIMKGFVDRIDEIDTLAQGWPGFISQPTPQDEGQIYPGNMLVNISIWDSVENLMSFTYSGDHLEMLRRRAEWFHQSEGANYILYWAPVGEVPTEVEIIRRFEHLNQNGPTPYAFSFHKSFTIEEMLNFQPEEIE